MTAPKPPPRTLQPAEERKIQLFLERAAPIVLENPHLTAERWQFLAALANELDLTADQFRTTIDDLLNRGVLKGLEVTPPKPPPLPGRPGMTAPAAEKNSPEDFALSAPHSAPPHSAPNPEPPVSAPSVATVQESPVEGLPNRQPAHKFDETSPPEPKTPGQNSAEPKLPEQKLPEPKSLEPKPPHGLDAERGRVAGAERGTARSVVHDAPARTILGHREYPLPQPPSRTQSPEPKPPAVPKPPPVQNNGAVASIDSPPPVITSGRVPSLRAQFLEQASAILAEQRGMNAKTQSLLAAAAHKIGLSEAAAREALQSLYQPAGQTNNDGAAAAEKSSSTRWRIEGNPPPVPAPPPKSPTQTFLEFARPSLAAVRDGVVSEELEQRLVAHATRVLSLSTVYARHLLLDLTAERKLRLASGADVPPSVTSAPSLTEDPRLADFLQAAKPILAQHRGLNTHSRMLINSLARERRLTEQEVDRAISLLTTREREEPIDRHQQERLVPFQSYVEAGLKKASRGILTPSLNDKFVNAGVELFGLSEDLAAVAVRETTDKLSVPVITREQAEQHVSELLQEMGVGLTRQQRDRIELEGAQWGLQATRVKELIEKHSRQQALQARSEERVSRWALTSAVVAVFLVIAFVIFAIVSRRSRNASHPAPTTAKPLAPVSPPEVKHESSWLDDHSNLSISVVNARSDFPVLRKAFIDLSSNDPSRRNTAYDAVVDYFQRKAADEIHRQQLGEMLSICAAIDPVNDSAGHLLTALLRDVPGPSDEFPRKAEVLGPMFWGVRVVAMALAEAKGQTERISQIVAALHHAIGITPDPSLTSAELEQICLRSLTERLFRLLIVAAGGPLADAATLHAALAREATRYLDAARLDKFNADFLSAELTKDPAQWRNFEDQLRFTAGSRDPLAVLRLVELYEATANSELRDFVGQVLLARTPGTPAGRSVEEIATFVRQGLGVTDAHDPDGVWTKLSKEARNVLTGASSSPEPATPILAEVLQLAHYATLTCAFAENEWTNAAIVELRKAGAPTPEAGLEGKPEDLSGAISSAPVTRFDRETLEPLRDAIVALTARRSQPTDRLVAIDNLARLVDLVPDLPPDMAAAVALHLLGNKSGAEHARVLQHWPTLAKWNQLLIALADRLEDATLTPDQLQSLINTVLGRERPLGEGKEGRAAARRELWQFTMRRLAVGDVPAKQPMNVPENVARLLAVSYETQAKLLKLTLPEPVVQARDPQVTLRAIVDEFLSRFVAAKWTDAQRAELAQLPHELTALEFVSGTNGVQRLVSLERIWLRLLALETARRNESRATEARELVAALQQKDRQAKHILSQLRDGQASQLQMWMLIGRRG